LSARVFDLGGYNWEGFTMATYKKPCIHCGEFVEGDSSFCPKCASSSPFSFHCPYCAKEIERGYAVCPNCGAQQQITKREGVQ